MPITSYEMMGWLRTAVGVALVTAPAAPLRFATGSEPTAAELRAPVRSGSETR